MNVDVHPSIWVDRPRDEVANTSSTRFTSRMDGRCRRDPARPARATREPATPISRVTFLGADLGEHLRRDVDNPDTYVEVTTDWPFPVTLRYELTRGSDGT